MTYARKSQVSLASTPYYHLVARCVRRAWLCGIDPDTEKDYSHRKDWVLERLRQLATVFAVDLCAYAIMCNHYHLVVHVDAARAQLWSPQEVVERWCTLFSKPVLVDRWLRGECTEAECEVAENIIELWRRRLADLSWYMRCLNEHIARRANAEDACTGRFWEGRFRSQALLDEAGLLTAMTYVDLNPIRAGIAETPEESQYTSIYERIREFAQANSSAGKRSSELSERTSPPILPLLAEGEIATSRTIPFSIRDYIELVDWSGRSQRQDKSGAIGSQLPSIFQRLRLDCRTWHETMRPGGNVFGRAVGRVDRMRLHAELLKQSWIRGTRTAQRLFA